MQRQRPGSFCAHGLSAWRLARAVRLRRKGRWRASASRMSNGRDRDVQHDEWLGCWIGERGEKSPEVGFFDAFPCQTEAHVDRVDRAAAHPMEPGALEPARVMVAIAQAASASSALLPAERHTALL